MDRGEQRSEVEGPSDLNRGSWWATLKRTVSEFKDDNGTDWAAALTYYAVLSIFPALLALVGLVSLAMDPETLIDELNAIIVELGPESATETLRGPIERLAENSSTSLAMLIVGFPVALWTASAYVGAFARASNAFYEVGEGRAFYKMRPLQMAITLAILVLVTIVLVALVVSGPVATAVGEALGVGSAAVTVYQIAKWPIMALLVVAILAVLYYSTPNARLPKFRWITPGSLVALVVWVLASAGFALYVANFGSYDKTYGTLGGAIVFLVWMWLTNLAVLFGQQLNAELERTRELAQGVDASRRIQLPERDTPKDKQLPDTAHGAHPAPGDRD
jgi:membrane protein